MTLALIGYFPKRTGMPAGWNYPSLTEVCSVSGCIAEGPADWINHWRHNELGFYNTRADAWSIVTDHKEDYQLFAYRLLPMRFAKEGNGAFAIAAEDVEPLPDGYTSAGFDVVTKTFSPFFQCSPLSCNGMLDEVPVNRYCLLGTLDEAIAFAEQCAHGDLGVEPGPYYVLEVLRV